MNGWEGEFIQEKEINVPVANIVIETRLSPMLRTKGSKNHPKPTTDFAFQIVEKQESIASLTSEITSITANIDTLKADLKAKSVFDALGVETHVINNQPNGMNINRDAGSTHIEGVQKFVVEKGLDVGFAYDGDADRCLCVDEKGNVINGAIFYIFMAAI